MARSLPPLTWFRAFESAARNLSFTAAAHELGLTQSAISQQVHSLELRFGCRLFVRKHRGLALTDEGRRLVPTVARGLGTLRTAAESFETRTDQMVLSVATSVSIAQWYLVPRLKAFCDAHDGASVRLMTKVWPDEFSGSGADVEIRFDSVKNSWTNSTLLGSNRIVLVAAPELVGENFATGNSREEIARHPLIQAVGTSDTWQSWADRQRFTPSLLPTYYVDSHGMAVDLAKSGAGVALTSSTIAAPSIIDGSLVLLDEGSFAAQDGYHLVFDPRLRSELPGRFADWLVAEINSTEEIAAVQFEPGSDGLS